MNRGESFRRKIKFSNLQKTNGLNYHCKSFIISNEPLEQFSVKFGYKILGIKKLYFKKNKWPELPL